jgi:membrane protein
LQAGAWHSKLAEARSFAAYLFARVIRDNCLQNAATLSYTTLLSIVPLLAVGFSVLAAFPVFEPLTDRIRLLIFTNLVPTTGEVVEQYVEQFISQAAGLTAAGIVGLMVSALLLMSAIDNALNDIWFVHKRRRPLQGFMVYWTVLTLSPLLIGVSVLLSTYLDAFSALFASGPRQYLLGLMPFLAEMAVFTFLYSAVPNRRVPILHALAGAALAALLFELAKLAFAWYVTAFPAFEIIYGAVATLPLFLVWVYLVWIIVLTGAEFTQALSGYRAGRSGALSDPRLELVLTVRVLSHLWHAQQHGVSVTRRGLSRREPDAGEMAVESLLARLEQSRVVQRTQRGGWILARDPNSFTLLDLYRSQGMALPDFGHRTLSDPRDRRLAELIEPVEQSLRRSLDVPLESLFAPLEAARTGDGEEGSQ